MREPDAGSRPPSPPQFYSILKIKVNIISEAFYLPMIARLSLGPLSSRGSRARHPRVPEPPSSLAKRLSKAERAFSRRRRMARSCAWRRRSERYAPRDVRTQRRCATRWRVPMISRKREMRTTSNAGSASASALASTMPSEPSREHRHFVATATREPDAPVTLSAAVHVVPRSRVAFTWPADA